MFYTSFLFHYSFNNKTLKVRRHAMRALVISTVVGAAVVLSGCQTTGNNLGGVEYDKAALGTLIGAAASTASGRDRFIYTHEDEFYI
jgi:hypothetical protein